MPWDRSKYPKNWDQIRTRILDRAKHRCERCGVRNHTFILRIKGESWPPDGWAENEIAERYATEFIPDRFGDVEKFSKVVLTIAHIHDPNPMNCSDSNLQALCQGCHNTLDAPMRAKNAAKTRARKKREIEQAQGQTVMEWGAV